MDKCRSRTALSMRAMTGPPALSFGNSSRNSAARAYRPVLQAVRYSDSDARGESLSIFSSSGAGALPFALALGAGVGPAYALTGTKSRPQPKIAKMRRSMGIAEAD
jgi:hypothetical protein